MSIVKYPKLYEQEKSIKKHVFTIVPTPAVALSVGQVNVLAADKNQVSGREADKATNLTISHLVQTQLWQEECL
ncbi:hypothetical protein QTL86_15070 [Cellulosilyticum sp. ST5]|uniref:hypothetical protein n=1 Tax=Cellulosilyticum sp. ST5 TaxID=3055805 RepID=UPI003977AC8A